MNDIPDHPPRALPIVVQRRRPLLASTRSIAGSTAGPGAPCWVELHTSNVEAACAFYSGLFDWTVQDIEPGRLGRRRFLHRGAPVAGLVANATGSGYDDAWVTYLASHDVAATVASAVRHGGQVVTPPTADAGLATALLRDPAGALIGVCHADSSTRLAPVKDANGVAWLEHHSPDIDWAAPFYQHVFGWRLDTLASTDQIRYLQATAGAHVVAGMVTIAPPVLTDNPSRWAVYFAVTDLDDALHRVIALGGRVLRATESTPSVSIADTTDPTGATLKLQHEPTPAPRARTPSD